MIHISQLSAHGLNLPQVNFFSKLSCIITSLATVPMTAVPCLGDRRYQFPAFLAVQHRFFCPGPARPLALGRWAVWYSWQSLSRRVRAPCCSGREAGHHFSPQCCLQEQQPGSGLCWHRPPQHCSSPSLAHTPALSPLQGGFYSASKALTFSFRLCRANVPNSKIQIANKP